MFQQSYSKSPLAGVAADELFPNIKGDTYNGDVSLVATMRVLLYDRLPEGKSAQAVIKTVDYSAIKRRAIDGDYMAALIDGYKSEDEDRLYVVNVNCGSERDAADKALKDFNGIKMIDDMARNEMIETNVFGKKDTNGNQVMRAMIFEDIARARTLIMVLDRLSIGKLHLIASLTSRYFKRYFDSKPITAWEKENIAAALSNEKSPDKYSSAVQEYSERFDFRTPMIMASLTGFENMNFKRRIQAVDRRIEEAVRQLNDWNDRYASFIREKRAAEDQKKALILTEPEGDGNSLRDFFLGNKNLHLESVSGHEMKFWAKTTLSNFDRDMVEQLLGTESREERSSLYYDGPSSMNSADRDLLYKAMFVDERVRLWMCGLFTLDDEELKIRAHNTFTPCPEMHDCMPNPHLYRHACMGDNQRYAIEALESGDYVLAVEQAVGSVASVNLNEHATTEPWMDMLFKDDYGKCWELRDGRRVKFSELMKILKKEAA